MLLQLEVLHLHHRHRLQQVHYEAGLVESVKAASDIYSPVTGEVIALNESLEDEPELINSDPYNDGWFFKVKVEDLSELEGMLTADDYADACTGDD